MEKWRHRCCGFTPATVLSLAALLFAVSFGWQLPPEYGTENGPLEFFQVGIFVVTAVVAVSALWQTKLSPDRRRLFALTSVVWLMCAARELSWGRVFYAVGPDKIPPLKTLWFGPYVYPVIAVILLSAGTYFLATGLHKELWRWLKQENLPALDFCLFVVFLVLADLFEHHSHGLLGAKNELFEELAELISYVSCLSFMINVIYNKRFRANQEPPT
ncbi:hypothetical protein [Sporomusa acidovorans]|uniref:Uncharacterized protein n=1 Tax=Sporomusa acidovorans (strain ATCC 49682 / DSM 3132 / Mol) TaxID=1123286 RepID=A0ABZ3J7L4_SPOA4|nr:hypothetical protein [Sporomusa acidovorans]OZC19389.1 hypothetical protein SPACI_29790 [Sporomusa acidovorans DSM 3132]SDD78403.1 hypothetical protein SAMN04488499_100437 [Sporomusa acidovorans]